MAEDQHSFECIMTGRYERPWVGGEFMNLTEALSPLIQQAAMLSLMIIHLIGTHNLSSIHTKCHERKKFIPNCGVRVFYSMWRRHGGPSSAVNSIERSRVMTSC